MHHFVYNLFWLAQFNLFLLGFIGRTLVGLVFTSSYPSPPLLTLLLVAKLSRVQWVPSRVLSQTRIFGPPSPPYRIDFAKNRKKSESTQNGLKRREIEKKIFAPWWPPPEKNLEKFSKIFLKIFWKLFRIIWNVKKTRKNFFHFFSVIPKKNLEKFSNFFFENFSKVVQNHLKREKNSKKKFSFFPYFGLG